MNSQKSKKYTWVVFLRILEQIWNPFNFKSFSLFHTRLSLEAFVLYNYVTVVDELGHIGYNFYKGKVGEYQKTLFDFRPRCTNHLRRSIFVRPHPDSIQLLGPATVMLTTKSRRPFFDFGDKFWMLVPGAYIDQSDQHLKLVTKTFLSPTSADGSVTSYNIATLSAQVYHFIHDMNNTFTAFYV